MADVTNDVQAFALALRSMDGVGRVTAARVLARFATYADLRRYGREQVLYRLKGAPSAAALVEALFDEAAMQARLDAAQHELAALHGRGVHVVTPADADWPRALDALPRAQRPFLLFGYGNRQALAAPGIAFFGRPGLAPDAFERAQATARHAAARGVAVLAGIQNGFDVAIHKVSAGGPAVLVAACGLARVAAPLRPVAAQRVRAGGLLLSPFEMNHGPFDHDDRERARLMAALARAVVFFNAPLDDAEGAALDAARTLGIPLFAADASLARREGMTLLDDSDPLGPG